MISSGQSSKERRVGKHASSMRRKLSIHVHAPGRWQQQGHTKNLRLAQSRSSLHVCIDRVMSQPSQKEEASKKGKSEPALKSRSASQPVSLTTRTRAQALRRFRIQSGKARWERAPLQSLAFCFFFSSSSSSSQEVGLRLWARRCYHSTRLSLERKGSGRFRRQTNHSIDKERKKE